VLWILVKQQNEQKNVYNDIKSGSISYSFGNCLYISMVGLFIGIMSVIFGAGGGSINNIMLILIGFDPLVKKYILKF
jgi:uncharacterized membrane protein YfcA